jgi:choline-glycine betaine transporter
MFAALIITLALTGVLFPELPAELFTRIQRPIAEALGRFGMISVAVFLILMGAAAPRVRYQ